MKAVVVHSAAKAVELDWAKQFAGLDLLIKNQFSAVDWSVRTPRVFTIRDFTWNSIVSTISDAAIAAGAGGVVIVASGHGGVVPGDPNGGVINWDPTDGNVALGWTPADVRKGLFWDDMVARYLDPIPMGNPPNQKGIDENNINARVKDFAIIQKRHDAFEALDKIGQALKAHSVARLTFTNCTSGRATAYMDRLAKYCRAEVACFKEKTRVLNDDTFGLNPGKSRMILDRDSLQNGLGTNTLAARVFTPDLDDSSIAQVANPYYYRAGLLRLWPD
jgi:hypothetical protein